MFSQAEQTFHKLTLFPFVRGQHIANTTKPEKKAKVSIFTVQ